MLSNTRCPGDLSIGDYVFASRWLDCDWNDPWCVGYVAELLEWGVILDDGNGTEIEHVGSRYWKYAMRITAEQGERILAQYPASEGLDFDPVVAELVFSGEKEEDSY